MDNTPAMSSAHQQYNNNNKKNNALDDKNNGHYGGINKGSNISESSFHLSEGTFNGGGGSTTMGNTSKYMARELVSEETSTLKFLRVLLLVLLLIAAALCSFAVYHYTHKEEIRKFETTFKDNALKVMDSFHDSVQYKLGAMNSLSSSITSIAKNTNQSFPFVTVPDFAVRGSDYRIQADAIIVHYAPLVTDENREEWEKYAMENRFHINEAFLEDSKLRTMQDKSFNQTRQVTTRKTRKLIEKGSSSSSLPETISTDGEGFHEKIWSTGAVTPKGDEPLGRGYYLPLWQRSPINAARQRLLNVNWEKTLVFVGVLPVMLSTLQSVIGPAAVPIPANQKQFESNLLLSHQRQNSARYAKDPITFIHYPIFDSFDTESRQLAGTLSTSLYWNLMLSNALPPAAKGIICVLENSFGQTFSYELNGPSVKYLGPEDLHDEKYNYLENIANVNEYLQNRASPSTQSYTTVSLNKDFGIYKLRVYPSDVTKDQFTSHQPIIFTVIVACAFAFTSFVFITFASVVERRQHIMMKTAVRNARKAARAERELNEFLSHEVRNPLAAAMSACSFVSSAVNDSELPTTLEENEQIQVLREDVAIITSSLTFINDFLRSMLDIHRANDKKLQIHMAPVDLLVSVMEPVTTMVYSRDTPFQILVDCPEDLAVMTDVLRLKQIMLNLVRNASKFVHKGYIRMRADVVDGNVCLYVEDSGPGIPLDKRSTLFQKFQTSLDVLSQGTGIGLSLCKNLAQVMDGDIWLDDSFDSGVEGNPGARFVVQLNKPPLLHDLDAFELGDEDYDDGDINGETKEEEKEEERYDNGLKEIEGDEEKKQEDQSIPQPLSNNNELIQDSSTTADIENGIVTVSEIAAKPTAVVSSIMQPPKQRKKQQEEQELQPLPEIHKVLFVDDDSMLRRLFSRAVSKVAPTWTIKQAANGETALRLVEEEDFDLIFLDQYMASVEKQLLGTETAKALRAKGVSSRICGLSANDIEPLFLKNGADFFLLKPMPCKKDELHRTLLHIIYGKRNYLPPSVIDTIVNRPADDKKASSVNMKKLKEDDGGGSENQSSSVSTTEASASPLFVDMGGGNVPIASECHKANKPVVEP